MDIKEFLQKKIEEVEAPLYHAISIEHFLRALEKNELEGRTTQRYWLDGIRRKDNDPLYETSKWMKGWSMTRDFDFAARWNGIIIVFDKNELQKEFEIEPYSWNFSIGAIPNNDHKKEREEFVISIKTNKSTEDYKKQANRENNLNFRRYKKTLNREYLDKDKSFVDLMKEPEGKNITNLSKKIKGIYISNLLNEHNLFKEQIEIIKNLPQFKGFFNQDQAKERYEKTIDSISRLKRNKI